MSESSGGGGWRRARRAGFVSYSFKALLNWMACPEVFSVTFLLLSFKAISQGQASFQDLLFFPLAELHNFIYFPLSKAATIYSLSNSFECSHLWNGVVYLHLTSCWRPISVLRLTVV